MGNVCVISTVQTRFLQNFITSAELSVIAEAFQSLNYGTANLYNTIMDLEMYKYAYSIFNNETVALSVTLPFLEELCESVLDLAEEYKVFDIKSKKIKSKVDQLFDIHLSKLKNKLQPFKRFHDTFQKDVDSIVKELDTYEYDEKYGSFIRNHNVFAQMKNLGYVSYSSISELQQLFLKAFKRTIDLLISPKYNLEQLPNVDLNQLEALSEIKKQANGDSKIFFKLLNENPQLNFQHILDMTMNSIGFSFFNKYKTDIFENELSTNLYKNIYFLKYFAPQFAMLAQSEIKNELKIKIPTLKYTLSNENNFQEDSERETNSPEENVVEDISEVDHSQNEDGDTQDEINSLYADNENSVQSRTQHWQNIFTTDLSKNLSRELQLLFNTIPNQDTVFDKYGYRNYYDSKEIYAAIRDNCFDCLDAVEMMDVLQSDKFNAPFKKDLIDILEKDVNLQIQLFTAMCTTRNKYIHVKNSTTTHVNEITSNDAMWSMLRSAVNDNNSLLRVQDSNDRTRDADFVVMDKNIARQYKAVLTEIQKLIPVKKDKQHRDGVDYWCQQITKNGKKYLQLMYRNAPISSVRLQTLFKNTKIEDLVRNVSKNPEEKLVRLQNVKDKSICDVLNDLCDDLGLTFIATDANVTNPAFDLLYKRKFDIRKEDNTRNVWYENRIEEVFNLFKNVLDGSSRGETNEESVLINNAVYNNPLKKLMYSLNKRYADRFENSTMVDGKMFQTFTYMNHINYIMREYAHKTPKEIDEIRDSFLRDYSHGEFDTWDGIFLNEPWFNSWMKDLLKDGGKTYKNKHKFELFTFLAFNNISWSELNDTQYTLAQFTMFHDPHLEYGLHGYTLPQMEDKSSAFCISQSAFSTILNEDGYSPLSYNEASLFMQELYRIKRIYKQAIANNNNSTASSKKLCSLQETTKNGIKTLYPFIDFNQNQGDARFFFLASLNKLLPYINESQEVIESAFSENEKKLIQAMRQYIYGEVEDTQVYETDQNLIPKENLTDSLLTFAAIYLHNVAYNDFENWFNEVIDYPNLFLEYLKVLNKYYNTNKKTSLAQLKDVLQDVTDDTDINVLIANIKTESNLMSAIKDKMFFQFYNQQYAGNQILSFFSGDCIQYGDKNTMTKRLSQFVASGLVPTKTMLYEEGADGKLLPKRKKRIVCFNDIVGNPLTLPMKSFLEQAFTKKFEEDYDKLTDVDVYRTTWVRQQVDKIMIEYDDNNSTDGQSLMSVDYLIVYLKSLGKLSVTQEAFLQKIKQIYLAKNNDDFDQAVKDYFSFLRENPNLQEINTLKTQTFTMLPDVYSDFDTTYSRKALQIKTADMLLLDVDSFIMYDKTTEKYIPKENHLMYRLQKWMLQNKIDGMVAKSTMKVYQPKNSNFVNLNAGNLSTQEIIDEIDKKFKEEDIVISVPISDNIYVLETPSEYFDTERSIGIQFSHLVAQNLDFSSDEAIYTLLHEPNKKFTAVELYSKMNELWKDKYNTIYDTLLYDVRQIKNSNMSSEQKRFNINLFWSKLLTEELIKSESFSYQSWYGLQLDANGDFNIPLNTPSLFILVQKLFTNIIKNKLIKAPVTGGTLIQTAQINNFKQNWKKLQEGNLTPKEIQEISKDYLDFQIEYDENNNPTGVISMEVEMPLYNSALRKKYMDQNGHINMKAIEKEHPELLDMVCYRIPTEGYYSMFRIHVKRFTNPKSGGNIVLPKAITCISGSDFDIDKMFFIAPAVNKDGEYITKSTLSTFTTEQKNTKQYLELQQKVYDNELLNSYLTILSHNSTLVDRFTPQGFTDIEDIDIDFAKIDAIVNAIFEYGEEDHTKFNYEKLLKEQPTLAKIIKENNFAKNLSKIPYQKLKDYDNPGNPLVQAKLHTQNSISKASVGIFANPNTIHSILTHYPITIKVEEGTNISIDGLSLVNSNNTISFSQKYCLDGITTQTSQLRQLLAAAVDDAKHPRFANLNINLYTADLISTLIQMGFTIRQAVLFINQPVVIKMVNDYSVQLMNTNSSYIDFPSYVINKATEMNTSTSFNFTPTTNDMIETIIDYNYYKKINATEEIDSIIEEQNGSVLPMLFKVAKVAHDFKQVIKKYKVDNAGATSWNDIYSYLKYRLDRDIFESKIINGNSEFTFTILEPFELNGSHTNEKLETIERLSDDMMSQLFVDTNIQIDIPQLVQLLKNICLQCGRDTLSMRDIRNVISALQTYKYVNDVELDELYYYGTKDEQSEFSKNVETFKAYCNATNQYKNLFGVDGLIVTKPKILYNKPSVNGFIIVNTYLASKEHTFKNAMMSDWEQMFRDNRVIPDTNLTIAQLALQLLNYCILKNGFNINYNSFASIIPYALTNDKRLRALKHCSNLTVPETTNKINDFIELFLRNNRNLVPYVSDINTKFDTITASTIFKDPENAPNYIKKNNICYKKVMSIDDNVFRYRRCSWLGAKEIAVEYSRSHLFEHGSENTNMQDYNRTWVFQKDKTADIETTAKSYVKMNPNFEYAIDIVSKISGSYNNPNDLLTMMKPYFKMFGLKDEALLTLIETIIDEEIPVAKKVTDLIERGYRTKTITAFSNKINEYLKPVIENANKDC